LTGSACWKAFTTIVAAILLPLSAASCAARGSEPPAVAADRPALPAGSVVTAVESPASVPTAVAVAAPAELSIETLGNATYRGVLNEPVSLTGGRYEGQPFVEGGASRPTVSLMTAPVAYGDLNGDGQNDAAVLLVSDSGGSGTFIYLAVVESRDGAPFNAATTLLGDRGQVRSLTIDGGRLVVNLLSHAADDPACCPTLETTRAFRLMGEQLADDLD
jgi:hypothetical protein